MIQYADNCHLLFEKCKKNIGLKMLLFQIRFSVIPNAKMTHNFLRKVGNSAHSGGCKTKKPRESNSELVTENNFVAVNITNK